MVYLASHVGEGSGRVHAKEISEIQDIPPHYLKQILARLRAAGLVRSSRGPTGGHSLGREAHEISVGEVVQCLEGGISGVESILAMPCSIGVGPSHCVIKELLLEVKRRVEDFLGETTLAMVAERQLELSARKILVQPRFLCEEAPGPKAAAGKSG
jgi:Rrf2 family iron-sulfur cluster assembly transcriptional regulator